MKIKKGRNSKAGLILDPDLEQFATKRQWELLQTWAALGSSRAAAEKLGVTHSAPSAAKKAVYQRAARQGYSPDHDMDKIVPEGFRVRGVSTYYGKDGQKRGQWVKSAVDRERQLVLFQETVEAFGDTLPRVNGIPRPLSGDSDFMACYPIGDHHMGLLVWGEEINGDDYDINIATDLLLKATSYLMSLTPNTERAALVFLGDFLHYDSFEAVTPTSRNQLDSDTRFPKMVRAGIKVMRQMIEMAAAKHQEVEVIVEIGNHDLASSIFIMEVLSNVYENNPRIHINTHPGHFHYFTFGSSLVGTHHGHGPKLDELPLIMAVDQPEEWGQSKHRYIWTGHVHHLQAKDVKGCTVESFRVLGPTDVWAHNKGYRSARDMKAIVLHKDHGEVTRFSVNPDMARETES